MIAKLIFDFFTKNTLILRHCQQFELHYKMTLQKAFVFMYIL